MQNDNVAIFQRGSYSHFTVCAHHTMCAVPLANCTFIGATRYIVCVHIVYLEVFQRSFVVVKSFQFTSVIFSLGANFFLLRYRLQLYFATAYLRLWYTNTHNQTYTYFVDIEWWIHLEITLIFFARLYGVHFKFSMLHDWCLLRIDSFCRVWSVNTVWIYNTSKKSTEFN